eukprot:CAMPEP_0117697522 /NCGR_PEP_ID=MMETSP0804-20121206/29276_1 /TAXON_ID=1074897 /ORGANISM="Tetraselmis astigmatica, Strain CCMP880" /LENGTH=47 /DNA_ID= /DNA_START= /DNA_END= /DNA_ORIENTATION=
MQANSTPRRAGSQDCGGRLYLPAGGEGRGGLGGGGDAVALRDAAELL